MKKVLKTMPIALLTVLFVLALAFAVLTGTTVLSKATDGVAEAAASPTISLSQLAGGSWTWNDHKTEVTIGQWKGNSFKRYTDNTLGVGYRYDSSSCRTTAGIEYTVPTGQTIESFTLSITTTAAVKITYQVYKSSASSPYGYDYPDSGIAAQSGNTYSVTNSPIYHRSTYKGTTLTGGDKITFAIYDSDVIDHSGSTIYSGGKVARDSNIAVTSLSITLNNAAYSVSITAGTGIKEAFLSTSSVATSGSASGTKFDVDSYVYGFVKLNAGYRKPNSANWTLIDGTANQENAIYRVAEQKVSSQNINFGTINAEAKTKNLYKMDGSISKGYETLNWGQAKTIPAITKTGYNFVNYNTAVDGGGTTYGDSSGVTLTAAQVNAIIDSSISSFYAQWSAKTFDVTFDKRGGTGGDDGVTMTYDQPAPGTIAVPSKPGYIFQKYTATHPTNYSVIDVYNSNGEATSSKWQIDSAVSPIAVWYGKQYKAYITAGTGVKSVYLSTSTNATPGSDSAKPSGASFTNGQYLNAYIVLERGYVPVGDWTLASGDHYVGDGVFRKSVTVDIPSDEEEDLQYDFGTINAQLGNFAVGVSTGTGVSTVKLSAKDDGTDLVNANSKFVFDSQVYAYATLSVGYKAQDGWTLIDGESNTAGALYLVDTIEHIDIDSDFGAISATPKQYTVTLEGLDDPITATYDAPLSAIEQLPTREGYTFVGYYDQLEGGNQYINEDGTSTGRTWDINEDAPQLYAHWLKTLVYEVNNYSGDYDSDPHTISYEITEPESGAVILFGTTEGNYVLAEDELPTYTNVGVYTIYYQISADVGGVLYKTVEGSATVTIAKVDTTALSTLIDEVSDYYDGIKDDYPTIASTLEGHKQQIINDYITEDNVTEEEVAAAVVELQGYLDQAYAEVVDELIDAIGVVDLDKEDEIYSARVAYNNLTAAQKALVVDLDDLVDAEIELVELLIADIAPFEYTQACKDKIDKAREFYDDLTNDQKAEVDNYQDLIDAEKAYDAIAKIEAIGKPVANDDATREKADVARAAVDALTSDQLALVDLDFIEDLENAEAVIAFMDKVNAIGTPEDTQSFRDKVADAANTCDNVLTPNQLALVPETVIKTLTDDEALVPVMNKIDALGTPANTDAFRTAVEGARTDYTALSDDQKGIFPADVLKTLEDDEAIIDAMDKINAIGDIEFTPECKALIEAARDAYDALSNDQKAEFPADALKVLEDDEAAYDAMINIDALGTPENTQDFRDKTAGARSFYNDLTDDQKALVVPASIQDLENAEAVIAFMDKVNAIGTPEDTQSFRDKVADAANTCDNVLTPNQLALVPEDVIKALTDDEALVPVMDAIDALGTPANTDAFRTAVDGARADYDALTDDQKDIFPADVLKTLEDDEAIIDALDEIDAIGDVEYTPASKALIDAAREEYDALSADQKAKFPSSDLKTLADDEKAYESMDKIHNIGEVENDAETKERIEDARATYDALTPDQKALVVPSFVKDLEDAEAAYDAIEQINAIGEIGYDSGSEEAIANARKTYDALSPEQKALVPQETVNALEADEQTFATKSDNAKKLYIALLVILAIALCVSICFLVFLLLKRKKDKDKKQEKVMSSVLIVPAILAASYYVSAPFVAIYVLSALLLVVVAADIFLAVKHKKDKEEQAKAEKKAEQKSKKQDEEPHDDAKNYVCIAGEDDMNEPFENIFEENAEEQPAEELEEVAADEQEPQPAEEELAKEEEPQEEPAPVEDVKKEEPITLKQSMSVAKHSVHSMKWNKKAIANDLRDRHAGEVEINERENYTSTGLPLADTHYAVDGKTRKCFIYVYETEGAPMLLINSDADLAEELNERHGNVHKSAFPKSKDLWFSLPLDDSYSQEEVQSILDRCHAYALGRDEKEFSLKESLALAKNVKSAHSQSKKSICEYLEAKYGDQVELNTRDNYTSTGLPLADTHYVKGEDGKSRCFVYVYETEGSMMLLTRSNYDFAKALKENHENVHRSAFPKAKEPWNMVLLDDSFSDEEVHELLDKLVELNK